MQNVIALEILAMVFSNFLIICLKKPNPGKQFSWSFENAYPFEKVRPYTFGGRDHMARSSAYT